MEFKR